ncbi:hypothetical protein M9Y10_008996 [Tritrichomonas musculus]|uniref:t-SNARE coiled-coil homology domain-containing protein n=1 Tax=Tritrichomonas musculus TaxID=1915356 RepID=A0ABR2IZJ3_9EUKA
MTFSKVKKQTLPEMITNFRKQFNEYKSSLENNPTSNPDPSSIHQITLRLRDFDFQMNRMERELSNASDSEVIECSDQLNTLHRQYVEFKQRWQAIADMILNEDNTNNNENNKSNELMVEQSIVDQETEELEYLAQEAQRIAQTSREINEINNNVYKELNAQHAKIISIDKITSDTVPVMQKGNAQLDKAEQNQKLCLIC